MPIFSRLSSAFWGYVSPSKPTYDTATGDKLPLQRNPDLKLLRARRSMSPVSRVSSWRVSSPLKPGDSVSQVAAASVGATSAGVKRKRTSTTTQQPVKRRPRTHQHVVKSIEVKRPNGGVNSGMDVDFEGDTTLLNSPSAMDVDEDEISSLFSEIRVSQTPTHTLRTPRRKPGRPRKSWLTEDALDDTLLHETPPSVAIEVERDEENGSIQSSSPEATTTGQLTAEPSEFPLQTRPLVEHLIKRGREAILPCHWAHDFKFLPAILFSPARSPTNEPSAIGSLSNSDFRAQKAFSELLTLGPRMRDCIMLGRDPEEVVKRGLDKYTTWALRDARIPTDADEEGATLTPPALTRTITGSRKVDVADLQRLLAVKLVRLEDQWRRWLEASGAASVDDALPVLIGVVVSHSLVAVVCLDSSSLATQGHNLERRVASVSASIKTVGMFDFGDHRLDVWNSIALALLVGHVRDVLRSYTS